MAKTPREEAISILARAIIPPPPGESEKAELYRQAGRTVVELSSAENLLALIFCILSVPVSLDEAKRMFSSQGGLEKKLSLVNFMVLHANRAAEIEVWSKIYEELNTHRSVRNHVAHQRMIMEYASDAPFVDVSLSPLFFTGKGKRMTAGEIKTTADELENINKRLSDFVGGLSKPS